MSGQGPLTGIPCSISAVSCQKIGTHILPEMGADVRIESPPGGNPSRAIPPLQQGVSHRHMTINGGKQSSASTSKGKACERSFTIAA